MAATMIANRAIDAFMLWNQMSLRAPLLRAAKSPEQTQHDLLISILADNADTEFGRDHGFADIRSFDDYRARVPIRPFDQLEPYILRQQEGEKALTDEHPVYYARTSGTTGRSKDIPQTSHGLKQVKDAQRHLALSLWRGTGFFKGSILGFASPAEEGRLKNGTPYGSISGTTYRSLSPIMARKFVLPPSAFAIKDLEAKYQAYALGALAADDITGLVAANPSSLLKVQTLIQTMAPELLETLALGSGKGVRDEAVSLAAEIVAIRGLDRANRLRETLAAKGRLDPTDIWPRLAAVATWTGGSCGVALGRVRANLPPDVKIVEYGYSASEFIGTATIDAKDGICLPQLTHHVYEFVPRADWEAGEHTFLGLHELTPGQEYYIFITTRSGLYRYHINDIVRAESGLPGCVAIRFLQKGRGITNITGEKVSEHQIATAVVEMLDGLDLQTPGFMALADEQAARYVLHIECGTDPLPASLADQIESKLRTLNSEYDDKRGSGRLHPLEVRQFAVGACDEIKRWSVESGVREAQYKPLLVAYARDWAAKLAPLTVDRMAA
ncbi:MAG: GH3 auxin-responsive promoter family protein [Pseudomonadota bacterium]